MSEQQKYEGETTYVGLESLVHPHDMANKGKNNITVQQCPGRLGNGGKRREPQLRGDQQVQAEKGLVLGEELSGQFAARLKKNGEK